MNTYNEAWSREEALFFLTGEFITYHSVFIQVIKYASPTSAGAECIDPDCSWVEHWYDLMQHISYFSFFWRR